MVNNQKVTRALIILFVLCHQLINAQAHNLIKSLRVVKNRIEVTASDEFFANYLSTNNFFVEYDKELDLSGLPKSILTIPYILCTIPMVFVSNQDWLIEEMDEDLYNSLQKIRKVFRLFYPSLTWSGRLIPSRLIKNVPPQRSECNNKTLPLLFSGGLDAVCASMTHYGYPQLLITICGADIGVYDQHLWNCVQTRSRNFAQTYGHYTTFIRTIFARPHTRLGGISPEIHNWWADTMMSLGYLGLVAPIFAVTGHSKLLIAGSYTKDYPFPCGTHPLIDNAISFAGICVHHENADLTRLEKIETIESICKKNNLPLPHLRVCWNGDKEGGNCCKCEKCLRTLNALLVLKKDHKQFGFDTTRESFMQETKKLWDGSYAYDKGVVWNWTLIQDYIKNGFCHAHDEITKNYFAWFCSVVFKSMPHRFGPKDKKQYSYWWERSRKGLLDYETFTVTTT